MPSALRRGIAIALGVLVTAAAVTLPAGSAFAHDQLLRSSPASGEHLDLGPAVVELEFADDVLTVGAVVIVADADGEDWVASEPLLEGTLVRVNLREHLPDAGYEIRWRVVSSDGHPISGLIPFTVGTGEPFSSVGSGQDSSGQNSPDDAAGTPSQDDTNSGLLRVALIGVGGAVFAVTFLVVIEIILRRRRAAHTTS